MLQYKLPPELIQEVCFYLDRSDHKNLLSLHCKVFAFLYDPTYLCLWYTKHGIIDLLVYEFIGYEEYNAKLCLKLIESVFKIYNGMIPFLLRDINQFSDDHIEEIRKHVYRLNIPSLISRDIIPKLFQNLVYSTPIESNLDVGCLQLIRWCVRNNYNECIKTFVELSDKQRYKKGSPKLFACRIARYYWNFEVSRMYKEYDQLTALVKEFLELNETDDESEYFLNELDTVLYQYPAEFSHAIIKNVCDSKYDVSPTMLHLLMAMTLDRNLFDLHGERVCSYLSRFFKVDHAKLSNCTQLKAFHYLKMCALTNGIPMNLFLPNYLAVAQLYNNTKELLVEILDTMKKEKIAPFVSQDLILLANNFPSVQAYFNHPHVLNHFDTDDKSILLCMMIQKRATREELEFMFQLFTRLNVDPSKLLLVSYTPRKGIIGGDIAINEDDTEFQKNYLELASHSCYNDQHQKHLKLMMEKRT
jgi:hypothetical protein